MGTRKRNDGEDEPINRSLSDRVLNGVLACLAFPFVLIWTAVRVYWLPCMGEYTRMVGAHLWHKLCPCWGRFSDKQFPATSASLGEIHGRSGAALDSEVEWRSAEEVLQYEYSETGGGETSGEFICQLFSGGVTPSDIAQGQLGDCWLLSAFACLAEFEGAVKRAFVNTTYSVYGQYRVRLWCKLKQRWIVVEVDDFFPCKKGSAKPMFADPHGTELWVLVLEKAFAKFVGTYGELDGGHPLWALEALTGDEVFKYHRSGKTWRKLDLGHSGKRGPHGCKFMDSGDEALSDDDMFQVFKSYDQKDAVLAAGSGGNDDTQQVDGLVQGHAYSMIEVKEVDDFKLVCLRNPWGSFEWKGAWADESELWQKHPKVKKECKPVMDADDGMFWMAWADFLKYFGTVDVCSRTRTTRGDLALDVHEQMGSCGPTYGCCVGCARFWCCCEGAIAWWNAEPSKVSDRAAARSSGGSGGSGWLSMGMAKSAAPGEAGEASSSPPPSAPPAGSPYRDGVSAADSDSDVPPALPAPDGWELHQAIHEESGGPVPYYYHPDSGRSAWCKCGDKLCEVHTMQAPPLQEVVVHGSQSTAAAAPAAAGPAAPSSSTECFDESELRRRLDDAMAQLQEKDAMIRKLQERMLLLPNPATIQLPQALPHGRPLAHRRPLPPMPPMAPLPLVRSSNAVAPTPVDPARIAIAQDVN